MFREVVTTRDKCLTLRYKWDCITYSYMCVDCVTFAWTGLTHSLSVGRGLPYVMQWLTHSLSVGRRFTLCHAVTGSLAGWGRGDNLMACPVVTYSLSECGERLTTWCHLMTDSLAVCGVRDFLMSCSDWLTRWVWGGVTLCHAGTDSLAECGGGIYLMSCSDWLTRLLPEVIQRHFTWVDAYCSSGPYCPPAGVMRRTLSTSAVDPDLDSRDHHNLAGSGFKFFFKQSF